MDRVIDRETLRGAVLAAAMRLVLDGGVASLGLRAIAREARVSPATLVQRWGSSEGLQVKLILEFGQNWLAVLWLRCRREGLLGLLPEEVPLADGRVDTEQLSEVRMWVALCELGRGLVAARPILEQIREDLRRMLHTLTGWSVSPPDLDVLLALVEGLWVAMTTPGCTMDTVRARAVLQTYVDAHGPFGTDDRPAPDPRLSA